MGAGAAADDSAVRPVRLCLGLVGAFLVVFEAPHAAADICLGRRRYSHCRKAATGRLKVRDYCGSVFRPRLALALNPSGPWTLAPGVYRAVCCVPRPPVNWLAPGYAVGAKCTSVNPICPPGGKGGQRTCGRIRSPALPG